MGKNISLYLSEKLEEMLEEVKEEGESISRTLARVAEFGIESMRQESSKDDEFHLRNMHKATKWFYDKWKKENEKG